MKKIIKFLNRTGLVFLMTMVLGPVLRGATIAPGNNASITPGEKDGLVRMREEEKLARDIYRQLYDQWNLQVFSNIARSEQRHTNAIKTLMAEYGVEDPTPTEPGRFSSKELQSTYDALIEQGLKSQNDALLVGATIEDLDIADLDKLLAETQNEDIRTVYENLNRGSSNHLKTFARLLEESGRTYESNYLTADRYQAVLALNTWNNGKRNSIDKGVKNGRGKQNASCTARANKKANKRANCQNAGMNCLNSGTRNQPGMGQGSCRNGNKSGNCRRGI